MFSRAMFSRAVCADPRMFVSVRVRPAGLVARGPRVTAAPSHPCRPLQPVTRAAAGSPQRSEEGEAEILRLTDSLRLLETERDEAVSTAESCARSAVKLEEMSRLLERLALDKVSEGDEPGARKVLQEKAAVGEVLSRTAGRATTNYALAAKLAEKIGQQQAALMGLLGTTTPATTSRQQQATPSAGSPPAPAAAPAAAPSSYASSGYTTSGSSSSSSTAGSGSFSSSGGSFSSGSGSSSSSGGGYQAPWEASLAAARARLAAAEADAAAAGRRAAWQAQESVEEARDRLRAQAWSSVEAGRSRIRQSATESIEQARARIAAEDAAVLAQVHELIARWKAGGYVPEADLDWAFRQLERRSWRE